MNRQQLGNGPPPSGGRFGGAGALSPSPASRQPSSHAFSSPSLQSAMNPSSGSSEDFPALSPSAATQGSSSLSNALFNSYASSANSPLPPGMSASALLSGQNQREFSQDDFPALGGYPSQSSQNQSSGGGVPSAAGPGLGGDVSSLSSGVNGISLTGRTAATAAAGGGQEQASALAALAAQQQHRASLLGAMNGTGSQRQSGSSNAAHSTTDKNSQQPWAASPSPAPSSFPSSLLANGTSVASSPLPPPSSTTGDQMRSPSMGNAGSGGAASTNAVAAAILAQAAQLGQNNRAASSTNALPPPSSATANSTAPSSSSTTANQAPGLGQIPQTPAQQVLFSPADRFGLVGLLHIIKTANTDQGMLALGNDLTNLGLDLGAPDNLYSNFITPWSDSKTAQVLNIEPEYTLPSCYNVQPPPANTKIGNFSDETLFFIFYSQPRDAMQEMAAHELYKHNWRYHKELKLWLTKEAGTEPVQKTATFERGSYIFFDPVLWERVRRDFILQFDQLETRRA